MNRIEFLKKAGALTALTYLGVSLESCSSDSGDDPGPVAGNGDKIQADLNQAPFSELQGQNGWVLHPEENILMVNVDSQIRAFSSVCPHSQCARNWNYEPGVFTCTCHNSKFDSTGGYLSGPANKNLTELTVTRDENIIEIG